MVLASPGIEIREIELTRSIDISDQTVAFVPVPSVKGPLDKVLFLSSRKELVDLLGEPTNDNFEWWFSAASIIQYGGILATYRPSTDDLNSATDTGVTALIKNYEDYYERKSTLTGFAVASRNPSDQYNGLIVSTATASGINTLEGFTYYISVGVDSVASLSVGTLVDIYDDSGATELATNVTVVAINTNTSGTFTVYLGSNTDITALSLEADADELREAGAATVLATVTTAETEYTGKVWDVLEYAPGKKWANLFITAPNQTEYGVTRNIENDEVHILVIDALGTFSGVAGTVLENWTGLSNQTNATGLNGVSIYYETAIEAQSNYIYFLGDLTNITVPTQYTLEGGSNYDFVLNSAEIESAVQEAFDVINDPETYEDIDFIVPGKITASIAAEAVRVADARKDCIACISPERGDVVGTSMTGNTKNANVIEFFSQFSNSSYAVFDNNYKYLYDEYNQVYRYVPCGADVAGLMINTINNSEPWFSPAGATRGNLRNAVQLAYNPTKAMRDALYTNRINPIVTVSGAGARLMGDKTALSYKSVFDRINVRLLFITLETFISRFARNQLFEVNDDTTRNNFRTTVESYLRSVEGRRGVEQFRVVCDTTNNTLEVINRNEFVADIYIRPSRSINFIQLNFIADGTNIAFSEIV